MNKEVVIVMGSHRGKGNTAYLVEELNEKLVAKGVKATLLDINKLVIKPCIDCDVCKNNFGKCVHNDDMTLVYEAFRTAQIVVVASPVYFNGVTSKLKTLVDRCQMIFLCDFAHKKPFVESVDIINKKGYIVSVGGAMHYPNQFLGNELSLKLVFDNLRVPLTEHLKYDNTDRFALKERNEVDSEVERIAEEITSEVIGIER